MYSIPCYWFLWQSIVISNNSNDIYIYLFIYLFYLFSTYLSLTNFISSYNQTSLPQTARLFSNIQCDHNIVECCYHWHQIFETEPQFVVLIKVNTNQNRNAKIRQYAPNWQMTLYQNDLIKTFKIIVNASAGYIWKYL